MSTQTDTRTPAELRADADAHDDAAAASFDRCDTDGFLSQWALGITARKERLQAELAENGGRAAFPALFDLDGNLVAAKYIETRYGWSWGIMASDDPAARFIGWFNPSKARSAERREATDRAKGYTVGRVLAPAKAEIMGSGTGLAGCASAYVGTRRTDRGFSRDAEILTVADYRDR